MKKTMTFAVILVLAVTFFFTLVLVPPADAGQATKEPIWQIFKDGKAESVKWVDADNPRFAVYDAGTAADESDDVVLDKETRLVWQKIPNSTKMNWFDANHHCRGGNWGGRKGYRLPTIEELQSLYDPTADPFPSDRYPLPIGHPFLLDDGGGQTTIFWTSTTYIDNLDWAYTICFPPPGSGCILVDTPKDSESYGAWCVRGGYGYDAY